MWENTDQSNSEYGRFSRSDRQRLESRIRTMKFTKGLNINITFSDLKICVKELHNITQGVDESNRSYSNQSRSRRY